MAFLCQMLKTDSSSVFSSYNFIDNQSGLHHLIQLTNVLWADYCKIVTILTALTVFKRWHEKRVGLHVLAIFKQQTAFTVYPVRYRFLQFALKNFIPYHSFCLHLSRCKMKWLCLVLMDKSDLPFTTWVNKLLSNSLTANNRHLILLLLRFLRGWFFFIG